MTQHTVSKIQAWASALISLLAAIVELVRVVQEIERNSRRWQARAGGYLDSYDTAFATCDYFSPSTDSPLHPGGAVWPAAYHLCTALLLIVIFLSFVLTHGSSDVRSEIPGTKAVLNRTRRLARAFCCVESC